MILRSSTALLIAAGLLTLPALASRVHRAPTSGHAHTKHHTSPKTHKLHGQQTIDPGRVTQIQSALIREHYLSGEPSSKWDPDTQAAMAKYQADQGWQSKITPDSRALIKLGLGPDHSDAINATKAANFNVLATPTAAAASSTPGLVAASGISH